MGNNRSDGIAKVVFGHWGVHTLGRFEFVGPTPILIARVGNATPVSAPAAPKPIIRVEGHYTAYNCSWGDGPIIQTRDIINLLAVPASLDWPPELNGNSFHRLLCLENWAMGRLNSYQGRPDCNAYLQTVLDEADRMERAGLFGPEEQSRRRFRDPDARHV